MSPGPRARTPDAGPCGQVGELVIMLVCYRSGPTDATVSVTYTGPPTTGARNADRVERTSFSTAGLAGGRAVLRAAIEALESEARRLDGGSPDQMA
jgi:hypothetical protein